jgi:hypothetical protein
MKLAVAVCKDVAPAIRRGYFLDRNTAGRPGNGASECEARRDGGASITPETRRDGEAKVAAYAPRWFWK